jgi:copper chaperone CopZ
VNTTTEQLAYTVPGMRCGHCRSSITSEVAKVAGVASVDVDLDAKRVTVAGPELDDAAVRAAIDEAGYDVA